MRAACQPRESIDGEYPLSSVIHDLDTLRNQGREIIAVLYMRVSTTEQRTNGNLKNRLSWLTDALENKGIKMDQSFTDVCSGRGFDNRDGLKNAANRVKFLQQPNPDVFVCIISDCANRFIRGENYNKVAHTDQPSRRQLNQLKSLGVPLVTVWHPDTPPSVIRSHETKINEKVGRPRKDAAKPPGWKKKMRWEKISKAFLLYEKRMSFRQIAKEVDSPVSTVLSWRRQFQTLAEIVSYTIENGRLVARVD